jgi:hypothetical protein
MGNPHVLVMPYPAQGHIIPLLELSQCLVQHGFKITFVNTEYNHNQIMNGNAMKDKIGNQIHLVSIPDGLETLEDRKKPGKLSEAVLKVLPGKLEELIEQINGSNGEEITFILADQSIGWALEIAQKKGIRRAAFCPAAAALLVLGFSIPKLIEDGIITDDGGSSIATICFLLQHIIEHASIQTHPSKKVTRIWCIDANNLEIS